MICTFVVGYPSGKREKFQFYFPGGYIGAIVPFAKSVARKRHGKLVVLRRTIHNEEILVDADGQTRDNEAVWLEVG